MMKQLLAVITLFAYATLSAAHDPGLSSVDLTLQAHNVTAKVTFSLQDIEALVPMDSDQDAEVTLAEQQAAKPKIAEWVAQGIQLRLDGEVVPPTAAGEVNFDDKNNAQIDLQYDKAASQDIQLQVNYLSKLPKGHKEFVTLQSHTGKHLTEKMLSQQDSTLNFSLPTTEQAGTAETKSVTFSEFLLLGIEHIVTGYDHLLFLFTLLVVTREFWAAFKIITFFTIAHSITLGLAGLNIVNIASEIVEPLIAATIVYVGVENILRAEPKGRQWLTFFFGLIHGFGFAAVLREMGISSYETGIMVPLFSFNLGVEVGQIAVATVALPIIWWLHKKPQVEPRLTPVCSILASLAGAYWLIERTLLT
jgi:hydrogenase/urease accessory protein HupE